MTAGKAKYRARQRVTFVVAGFVLALITYSMTNHR
jgi:hypothetical protein